MSINGVFKCPVSERNLDRLDEAHDMLQALSKNLSHLEKLNTIANEATRQTDALNLVRDKLIVAATGKEHLTAKIMGMVIAGLIFIIIFLLTGEKVGLFRGLH